MTGRMPTRRTAKTAAMDTPLSDEEEMTPEMPPGSDANAIMMRMMMDFMKEQRQWMEKMMERASISPTQEPSASIPTGEHIIRDEVEIFRREAKTKLGGTQFRLTGANYMEWKQAILSDAHLIDAKDILVEGLKAPPEGYTRQERAIWAKKDELLFDRIYQHLSPEVHTAIDDGLEDRHAATIWKRLSTEYGITAAQERFQLTAELRALQLQNGDFMTYMRTFRNLRARLKNVGKEPFTEAGYHDLFLDGLGNWQKDFVQTRLHEFFTETTKDGDIKELDLEVLMDQLALRANKATTNTGKPKAPGPQCSFCGSTRHSNENDCWRKHPEQAPDWWKDKHMKGKEKDSEPPILISSFIEKEAENKEEKKWAKLDKLFHCGEEVPIL